MTDNLNQSITYTYDEHKNVVKTETTSSDGWLALLVDSVYDTRNRLTETRAPHVGTEESITQRVLDNNSNLVGLVDPNGNNSSNAWSRIPTAWTASPVTPTTTKIALSRSPPQWRAGYLF